MGGGLVSGIFWGTVTSALVVGGASLMAPLPETPQSAARPAAVQPAPVLKSPQADPAPAEVDVPRPSAEPDADAVPIASEISVPAGSEFAKGGEDTDPALPAGDDAPDASPKVALSEPETSDGPALETAPAGAPETASVAPQPVAPEASAGPTLPVATEAAPETGLPVVIADQGAAAVQLDPETTAPAAPQVAAVPETVVPEAPESVELQPEIAEALSSDAATTVVASDAAEADAVSPKTTEAASATVLAALPRSTAEQAQAVPADTVVVAALEALDGSSQIARPAVVQPTTDLDGQANSSDTVAAAIDPGAAPAPNGGAQRPLRRPGAAQAESGAAEVELTGLAPVADTPPTAGAVPAATAPQADAESIDGDTSLSPEVAIAAGETPAVALPSDTEAELAAISEEGRELAPRLDTGAEASTAEIVVGRHSDAPTVLAQGRLIVPNQAGRTVISGQPGQLDEVVPASAPASDPIVEGTEAAGAPNSAEGLAVDPDAAPGDASDAPVLEAQAQVEPVLPGTQARIIRRGGTAEAETTEPEVSAEAPASNGGIGARVVPFTERSKTVRTDRLPRIGDTAPEAESATVTPEVAPEAPATTAEAGGETASDALTKFAAAFENPDDKPLFSVVLIDAGNEGLGRDALQDLGFPVSIAIDPSQPGASQAAEDYRAAGLEVLILASGLPVAPTAQDVEITLSAYRGMVPEAVGILDVPQDGLQSDPSLTAQALAIAQDAGFGMVFYDQGLNSAKKAADRDGQPATLVFRALDADNESSPVVQRYLDRAVFKAGQEGAVVMVGHSYAETVEALTRWAAQGKAGQVALAPVSAVLKAQ